MPSTAERAPYGLPPPARLALLAAGMLALTVAVTPEAAAQSSLPQTVVPEPQRKAELVRLVRQDCGSCHGLTLRGGLGPPLVAAALRERPLEFLKFTILQGRRGTAMPPWRDFLTDDEATWITVRLLAGFPDER